MEYEQLLSQNILVPDQKATSVGRRMTSESVLVGCWLVEFRLACSLADGLLSCN